MIGCGGECARSGSLKCRCTSSRLRIRPSPVAPNDISKSIISNVSLPTRSLVLTNPHARPLITYVRDEMASRRNAAPQSPATDPTTRYGGGDVLGDGRGLDRRGVIGHQDPRLQSPDGCVEPDTGRLPGRGLGRLVSRERDMVVAFAEEEEYEFGIRWVGTENFVGREWWM